MNARSITLGNNNAQTGHTQRTLSRGTLDKYRLVVACIKGNVSVRETMKRLLAEAIEPAENLPVLILGPTAPEDLQTGQNNRVGWVTFVNGTPHPSPHVEIISPDNLL